jgi:hypothetical protein
MPCRLIVPTHRFEQHCAPATYLQDLRKCANEMAEEGTEIVGRQKKAVAFEEQATKDAYMRESPTGTPSVTKRFRAASRQLHHLSLASFNLHKARVRRASGFLLTAFSNARPQSSVLLHTAHQGRASEKALASLARNRRQATVFAHSTSCERLRN